MHMHQSTKCTKHTCVQKSQVLIHSQMVGFRLQSPFQWVVVFLVGQWVVVDVPPSNSKVKEHALYSVAAYRWPNKTLCCQGLQLQARSPIPNTNKKNRIYLKEKEGPFCLPQLKKSPSQPKMGTYIKHPTESSHVQQHQISFGSKEMRPHHVLVFI